MYVNPDIETSSKTNPSVNAANLKPTKVSSSYTVLFAILAIGSVAFMHAQSVDGTLEQDGEFAAHAFSEEIDSFTLLEERENSKKHFTSDTANIIPIRGDDFSLLEERTAQRLHFTSDTVNVIPIRGDDFSLLEERTNTRNHFEYGLI